MKIFNSLFDINIKTPTAITIGKFDGIHQGHHLLTSEIISKKSEGLSSCIITFKDITASLFTNKERNYILEKNGINYLFLCEFNKKFMEIEAIKFIEILCNNLNMKYLVVGEDFTFGNKGKGNIELLKKISKKYCFELKVINKIKKDNKDISSSLIREELLKGNIDKVNKMLGYEYFIFGEAIFEENFKNKVGNSPIFLFPPKDKLIPKYGLYFTKIQCEGKIYNGITKIGKNLVESNDDRKCSEDDFQIETYILENKSDIYGKIIKLSFIKNFGDKMRFLCYEEIKDQLNNIKLNNI